MYKKYRYNNTTIHIVEGSPLDIRLLQHEKLNPLSYLRYGNDKPKAVINCSYFSSQFVLGRNQGDLRNDTHDQDGFYDLVFLRDGTYRIGNFKSWDYTEKVNAGFSVATILILDSMSVNQYSNAICQASKLSLRNPQTAIGVLANGNVLLIVADGRTAQNVGLTGYELRTFIKNNYPTIELLCQLDGGGSTEMIVNGKIVNVPSDGKERNMFNGLAFIDDKLDDSLDDNLDDNLDKPIEIEPLMCPFKRIHVTQYDNGSYSHQGSDAWDITSGTAGIKDPYFAPCDLVCKAIDLTYAFTWWQSVYKVKFADGTVDYVTMMFGHDENINAKVGMTIKKGTQIGNMGTGGKATGKMLAQ